MGVGDLLPQQFSGLPPMVEGVVASTATSASDEVFVTVPTFNDGLRFGPCKWYPRFNGTVFEFPTRDQKCLIGFDENRDPWLLKYGEADLWTAPSSLATLDADIAAAKKPQEIIVGEVQFAVGDDDNGYNIGNVNGATQIYGSSWMVMYFPPITGYDRQYRMDYQAFYTPLAGVTGNNYRLFTADNNTAKVPGTTATVSPLSFTTSTHVVYPLGNPASSGDVFYEGTWTDCETELSAGGVDTWSDYLQQVGNAVGNVWSMIMRKAIIRGRYVEETP